VALRRSRTETEPRPAGGSGDNVAAVVAGIARQASAPARDNWTRIGDLVTRRTSVTQKQVAEALLQQSASGKPLDFSHVVNVWGKSTPDGTNQTNGQSYNQQILGVIPFGDLPLAQRGALLKLMQSTYSVDYSVTQKKLIGGRPVYTYRVQVMPEPYIKMLKQFATDTGLTQLETIDPAQYASASPLPLEISVDVWSRQIKTISYGTSDRQVVFSQLGKVMPPVVLPSKTVSVDELESRLQSIQ